MRTEQAAGLDVLEQWWKRVWENGEKEAIAELFADGPMEGLDPAGAIGPKEYEAFFDKVNGLIENIRFAVERGFQDGDWISALCRFEATAKRGGRPVSMQGQVMGRIVDGKIREGLNHWDWIGFFEQLGLLPENVFGRCLDGERIVERIVEREPRDQAPHELQALEAWYRRVWAERDASAIDELFVQGPAQGLKLEDCEGPCAFKEFHRKVCDLMDDISITVDKYAIADGEPEEGGRRIFNLCSWKATDKATGKPVEMTGHASAIIDELGRLKFCHNHWEWHELFAQMGLMPEVFGDCLEGRAVSLQREDRSPNPPSESGLAASFLHEGDSVSLQREGGSA